MTPRTKRLFTRPLLFPPPGDSLRYDYNHPSSNSKGQRFFSIVHSATWVNLMEDTCKTKLIQYDREMAGRLYCLLYVILLTYL